MTGVHLARATDADIEFILRLERLPGYQDLVGQWDEVRHHEAMTDGRHAYFIGRDHGEPVGFVIVRDWASPDQVTLVKRIAVAHPGQGHGRKVLRAVVDAGVTETEADRVWLGVFVENLRARSAYRAVGFKAEGVARGSAFFGGRHRDELVMAMLRPEWEAIRRA
jgi:RimJ/RimL family protein N-acetyltransferase